MSKNKIYTQNDSRKLNATSSFFFGFNGIPIDCRANESHTITINKKNLFENQKRWNTLDAPKTEKKTTKMVLYLFLKDNWIKWWRDGNVRNKETFSAMQPLRFKLTNTTDCNILCVFFSLCSLLQNTISLILSRFDRSHNGRTQTNAPIHTCSECIWRTHTPRRHCGLQQSSIAKHVIRTWKPVAMCTRTSVWDTANSLAQTAVNNTYLACDSLCPNSHGRCNEFFFALLWISFRWFF